MDQVEQLWKRKDVAHRKIQDCSFTLRDIAECVDYLHPELAKDLRRQAYTIEAARKEIQNCDAEEINLELKQREQASKQMLGVLLDKALNG
jgi:hypothetical protein